MLARRRRRARREPDAAAAGITPTRPFIWPTGRPFDITHRRRHRPPSLRSGAPPRNVSLLRGDSSGRQSGAGRCRGGSAFRGCRGPALPYRRRHPPPPLRSGTRWRGDSPLVDAVLSLRCRCRSDSSQHASSSLRSGAPLRNVPLLRATRRGCFAAIETGAGRGSTRGPDGDRADLTAHERATDNADAIRAVATG
jgi:hypothetical protein